MISNSLIGGCTRLAICCLVAILPAFAQHRLFLGAHTSKGWVVGAKLQPSGLFARAPNGWTLLGYPHPAIITLDYDPRDPHVLYIAAGNGCIRSADSGRTWTITTGWEVTETQDVSVDRNRPDHVWIGLPDGVAVTRDQGGTWSRVDLGVKRQYTQTVAVDRATAGRVLAGTEGGVLLTEDDGATWRLAGPELKMTTHLEQSPYDSRRWIATTQSSGAFESSDGGAAWSRIPGVPRGTLHNVAFDPAHPKRIAIAGWGAGIAVSDDGGVTWSRRDRGLPSRNIWRAVFDPDRSGTLYASVHEEAVFVSGDAGRTWRKAGLEGSLVTGFVFVPEPRP